ncbi:hypothetical protein CMUS01_09010 [Colletotrichum musicola]|uniref:Uncharacterized protein n=1 Tax=Colletotrichum musicola TaxID=2175873 RepID=A0A8H6NC40_9PEZI|nr:hypothetical protein CMUS01_09010 [Colletotrichum musicola]
MAGTAPNDPAPGGHDSNPAWNTHGSMAVDRNVGETIDATKSKCKSGISSRVDDVLNKTSAGSSGTSGAEGRKLSTTERGFKVGEEADMHGLASSKQP